MLNSRGLPLGNEFIAFKIDSIRFIFLQVFDISCLYIFRRFDRTPFRSAPAILQDFSNRRVIAITVSRFLLPAQTFHKKSCILNQLRQEVGGVRGWGGGGGLVFGNFADLVGGDFCFVSFCFVFLIPVLFFIPRPLPPFLPFLP